MITPQEIDQVVKELVSYGPEKIILFGSAARGDMDEYSDLDVLVVKRTEVRFLERLVEAASYITLRRHVDVFVYTPEEFRDMVEDGNPFIESALRGGRIVYEKAR